MAARRRRRDGDHFEDVAKLVLFVIVALAFAIGGISGFPGAFFGLIVLLIGLVVIAVVTWIVLRSRLVALKKVGLLMVEGAIVTLIVWNMMRAPVVWRKELATVVSITGPAAETKTSYVYHPDAIRRGISLYTSITNKWASLAEANAFRPRPIPIYYNPANPSEVRIQPRSGWWQSTGTPITTQVKTVGVRTAKLRLGSILAERSAMTTGAHVDNYKVGERIPVWINPLTETELSFEPRTVQREQRYWQAILAGFVGAGGVFAVVKGSRWIKQAETPAVSRITSPGRFAANEFNEIATPKSWTISSIRSALDEIDWFQFEKFSSELLRREGFEVERRGGAHPDGGVDLIAMKDGVRTLVQCKHWRDKELDLRTVRELLGSMVDFNTGRSALYTLKGWTEPAAQLALRHGIILEAGGDLAVRAKNALDDATLSRVLDSSVHHCPKCEGPMVLKRGSFSPFWSCARFPACRGKMNYR